METLQRHLEELKEWCPEHSCCGGREAAVTALRRRVSRLFRCARELAARSKRRVAEWSEITSSVSYSKCYSNILFAHVTHSDVTVMHSQVEKASEVLEQVEAELPDGSGVKAPSEELQDLLQSWEQYQDRLDCEHRALSALELRAARLLAVPAHLEQAPPTPLCQQLQAMQARYGR